MKELPGEAERLNVQEFTGSLSNSSRSKCKSFQCEGLSANVLSSPTPPLSGKIVFHARRTKLPQRSLVTSSAEVNLEFLLYFFLAMGFILSVYFFDNRNHTKPLVHFIKKEFQKLLLFFEVEA